MRDYENDNTHAPHAVNYDNDRKERNSQTKKVDKTGIPHNMKVGTEISFQVSLDQVSVHYDSEKPLLNDAPFCIEGWNIYIATGQEAHLSKALFCMVQQIKAETSPQETPQNTTPSSTQTEAPKEQAPMPYTTALDDDNGEITLIKGDKNAEEEEKRKNRIVIKQEHVYYKNFVDLHKNEHEISERQDWKAEISGAIARFGMADGSKKFTVEIEGEEWEVEFHLKVKEFKGTVEEWGAYRKKNPLSNMLIPLQAGETSQANGVNMFIDVSKMENHPSTAIHEMLHNLGLNHDNTLDEGHYSIMSYDKNRKITKNDLKLLLTDAVKLANKIDQKQVKIQRKVSTHGNTIIDKATQTTGTVLTEENTMRGNGAF